MKGPFLLGVNFGLAIECFRFGLQPHLVSFFEGFETLTVSGGHDLVGKFMSSKSFISGSIEDF